MKKKIILFIVVAMIVVATFSLIGGAPPSKSTGPKGPKITISAAPTDTFTVDDIPPVITITGDNPVTIAVGDKYKDAGATANDNVDGDISKDIIENNNVDTTIAGTYSVIYYVTDSAGNHAQDTRVVNVIENNVDITPPIITIIGNNPATLNVGDTYVDEGATAYDDVDGDITNKITNSNNVNTAVAGVYHVIYYATDNAGNHAQDTRVVNVIISADTTPPVIIAPPNITKIATGDLTKVNLGNPDVTDDTDKNPVVTNDAPAGSNFPLGTTQVTWTATDNSGNSNSSIQFVTIEPTTVQLAITNYTPLSTTVVGIAPSNIAFNIITNQAANVVWNLDGVSTPGGQSVTEDSYSMNIPKIGTHKLTATVQNGTDSNSVTWNLDIKGKLEIVASPSSISIGNPTNVTFKVSRACGIEKTDTCTGSTPVGGSSISLSGVFTGSGITNSTTGEVVITINTNTNGTIEVRASKSGYIDGNITILSGIAPTPTPPPSSGGSSSSGGGGGGSSSGGGGGGGGLASAEPFDNIYKYEVQENQVSTTPVSFKYRNPELAVYEVMVTSTQSDMASLRIEVLKGTSKLVNTSAPGVVYKNINAWIDYKRIKNATMRFKVDNSWMNSNGLSGSNIKMSKWDTVNKKWIELLTIVTNKDDAYTYFESQTDTFSSFAINGVKYNTMPDSTEDPYLDINNSGEDNGSIVDTPITPASYKFPKVETALSLIVVGTVLYFYRKRKQGE